MIDTQGKEQSAYYKDNKFFILHNFNNDLRDGIIIPLTLEIEKQAKKKDGQIDIYINSRGGDGMLCWYIVRLMELAKAQGVVVRTIVMETAYSAGSIVAVAGSPGERYISQTGEHCVHYGSQGGWTETTPLQIERNTGEKQRWFRKNRAHYEKYTNIPNLEKHMRDDSFFIPGKQAIRWGLADKPLEKLT